MPQFLVIGSLTRASANFGEAHGVGITIARFDPETGRLEPVISERSVEDSGWIAFDETLSRLYVACEITGADQSAVACYEIDPASGRLAIQGTRFTGGQDACHVAILPGGGKLAVANYCADPVPGVADAGLAIVNLNATGGFGDVTAHVMHGIGPNPFRQLRAHCHQAVPSPDGGWLFVTDLGADCIRAFSLEGGTVTRRPALDLWLPPGTGPRHMVFAAGGNHAYLIAELRPSLAWMQFDAATGRLKVCGRIEIPAAAGPVQPSGILATGNSRWLIAGLRLSHEVLVAELAPETGAILSLARFPCGGLTPRDLTFSPSGRHVVVANQDSSTVTFLPFDPDTGQLGEPDLQFQTGSPMTVCFACVGSS